MIETIRIALSGLSANKLRSALTILGLMIGVGSVIVLVAVGTGSSAAVQSQIEALGSNVLLVSSTPTLGGLRGGGGASTTPLTVADADALENKFTAPDVAGASPGRECGQRDTDLQRRPRTPRRRLWERRRATGTPVTTR